MEEFVPIIIENIHLIAGLGVALLLGLLTVLSKKTKNTIDDKIVEELKKNHSKLEEAVIKLANKKLEIEIKEKDK